jgi:GNAT superfamily N-acetyltransferase
MAALNTVQFVEPDLALLRRLLPVARRIFSLTFAARYDEGEFERFCDETYATDGVMARDFQRADVNWQVAIADDEPIGYAKLTALRAPANNPRPGALELQQIYVLPDWHGTGVAGQLIDWALERARAHGAPEIYLTVFNHNERAKRFYTRYGFDEVGHCTFQLGSRLNDDRIWRRPLERATDKSTDFLHASPRTHSQIEANVLAGSVFQSKA